MARCWCCKRSLKLKTDSYFAPHITGHDFLLHLKLLEVKKQLETEVQHLTSSFGQLKAAQAKFKSCIESVATVKPENKGA